MAASENVTRKVMADVTAHLEACIEVLPGSVRILDAGGLVVRENVRAVADHEQIARTLAEWWQLSRPRSLSGGVLLLEDHPAARALKGEAVRGETLIVSRGSAGNAFVDFCANPLRDSDGRVIGAVVVECDVTQRVRTARALEEQVRRSAELYERVSNEAERLERIIEARTSELLALQEGRARERRLAAVGQLAAGVMHDVNNALNPIMAAAFLLQRCADDPEAVRGYAFQIAKAAETGAATASRVGRFIRQEPLMGEQEEVVDLASVVEEAVAITRPLWAERVRGGRVVVESSLEPGVLIRGVSGEIREALLNLVQNSLDAMAGDGVLAVRVRLDGDKAVLEIQDTGVGMSSEVRERALEPFFSTKGTLGTGLGLSEVYGIVRRHRGSIEIHSAPDRGTRIRLTFPSAEQEPLWADGEGRRVTTAPRHVLLVEDHVEGRRLTGAVLEHEGHRVDAVGSCAEALQLLEQSSSDPYDVLLTDLGLPDGSGWELVEKARQEHPKIRIGVITGWELRTRSGGVADFTLRKPVRSGDLLAQIAQV